MLVHLLGHALPLLDVVLHQPFAFQHRGEVGQTQAVEQGHRRHYGQQSFPRKGVHGVEEGAT